MTRDELVLANRHLAYWTVHRFQEQMGRVIYSVALAEEELIGEALLALVIAANKFDPTKGYAFSTWAVRIMKNALIDVYNTWKEQYQQDFQVQSLTPNTPEEGELDEGSSWVFAQDDAVLAAIEQMETFLRFFLCLCPEDQLLLRLRIQRVSQAQCALTLRQTFGHKRNQSYISDRIKELGSMYRSYAA